MATLSSRHANSAQSGQATTEYILLLSIVVMIFVMLSEGLARTQLIGKLTTLITTDFSKAYQNGHYAASAPDDPGGAFKHPRATGPESFRIIYLNGSN
ncbi:MAG: hypothetical protein P4M08_08475 [Oligoflexia bacterium]|nr:hypothetical protein [Oligoflexia bacterium]